MGTGAWRSSPKILQGRGHVAASVPRGTKEKSQYAMEPEVATVERGEAATSGSASLTAGGAQNSTGKPEIDENYHPNLPSRHRRRG